MAKRDEKPCPRCGHCPTCGRAPARVVPYYPYPPPYWATPYWVTTDCWGSSNTTTTGYDNVSYTITTSAG